MPVPPPESDRHLLEEFAQSEVWRVMRRRLRQYRRSILQQLQGAHGLTSEQALSFVNERATMLRLYQALEDNPVAFWLPEPEEPR